ncbi:hypothetical protein [Photobacterium arenosum]|uniref:hypothetical protein n=1 Tax=Photobacterium arenosum TaxID=2774143 RepID=UPI002889EBEE|nr:hypothetical protein [Photobacterium arenosum]
MTNKFSWLNDFFTLNVFTEQGKNSGRIFRLSAPGAPTTAPDNTREQKGISGDYLCQQRVTGAHPTMPNKPQNPMRDIPPSHQTRTRFMDSRLSRE